jgi:hypothetical protein
MLKKWIAKYKQWRLKRDIYGKIERCDAIGVINALAKRYNEDCPLRVVSVMKKDYEFHFVEVCGMRNIYNFASQLTINPEEIFEAFINAGGLQLEESVVFKTAEEAQYAISWIESIFVMRTISGEAPVPQFYYAYQTLQSYILKEVDKK